MDCSFGHKFCNFCIQSWINFERHLVTECPVCRGSIFGKSLDLKTDAEIRAIFDTLSEEDKRTRLLAIKERLRLEYPNANPYLQAFPSDFSNPMRLSNAPHQHFNRDLHIPIPMTGMGQEETRQTSTTVASGNEYNDFPNHNYTMNDSSWQHWQSVWSPQGLYYPQAWNNSDAHSQYFRSPSNIPEEGYHQAERVADNVDIQHQHYHHHQNQENSRWNTNLYLTHDEETLDPASFAQLTTRDSSGTNQQQVTNSSIGVPSNSQGATVQVQARPNLSLPQHVASITPQNEAQMDQYPPVSFTPHSNAPQQLTGQPRVAAQQTPLQGFYCCYPPSGPGHHYNSASNFQFMLRNTIPTNNSQQIVSSTISGQMPSPTVRGVANAITSPLGNPHLQPGSARPVSQSHLSSPRIRPNMPGTSSTPIQLPSPSSSNATLARGNNYRRMTAQTNGNNSHSHHSPRIRQLVARCPARNARAHFSGGFSLFSSGYMGFQVYHLPTTMMLGDRCVTSPPARLTHPLVSLIPLNLDGSSTRVCLTFEVHRA